MNTEFIFTEIEIEISQSFNSLLLIAINLELFFDFFKILIFGET